MSNDRDKTDKGKAQPASRPGVQGGSARRAEVKPGIWQRVVDWVAPPVDESDAGAADRVGLELLLPRGTRLAVVVRRVTNRSTGVVELQVEPPPANDPRVILALDAAASAVPVAAAGSAPVVPAAPLQNPPAPRPTPPKWVNDVRTDEFELPAPVLAPPKAGASPLRPLAIGLSPADLDDVVLLDDAETPTPELDLPVVVRPDDYPALEDIQTPPRGVELPGVGRPLEDLPGQLPPMNWREAPESASSPGAAQPVAPLAVDRPAPDRFPASRPPRPDPRRKLLPVVGIDFGTTYSSVAVMRAGLEVIPDERGEAQTPSVVSFPKPGEVLLGDEARSRMGGEAQWTIASPKRLLGRLYKDPQVASLLGGLAFRTFAGTDKFVRFEAHGQIYTVTEICSMILGKLRERACRFLGAEVSRAVFTVPVGFGTLQRSALELAARQAGLEVAGMLTEPSAGVLSHGFRGQRGLVAVYDFGGGTFDFCLLEISATAFQVLCAGGDPWLGGDDFDRVIAAHLADLFWKETGVDLRTRAVEWQALIFACERAKRELSSKKETEVRCDDLLFTAQGKRGLRYKVSRKDFVGLSSSLVEKATSIARQVMQQAGVQPRQVSEVVLIGGTSLIPAVRDAVTQLFGRKPVLGDPNLAVVKGAALRGAELSGDAMAGSSMGGRTLSEVAGRTIGFGPPGGRPDTLFERDTALPAEQRRTVRTQTDNQAELVLVLYEESKSRLDESRTIGTLRYRGIRPAPAGVGQVDLTFKLDTHGLLHVSAVVEGELHVTSVKLD